MKRFISIVLIVSFFMALICVTGCADNKNINGKTYKPFGLISMVIEDNVPDPKIQYDIAIGNIVWSCLLIGTVIAPIYFLGFALYEPIGVKS